MQAFKKPMLLMRVFVKRHKNATKHFYALQPIDF